MHDLSKSPLIYLIVRFLFGTLGFVLKFDPYDAEQYKTNGEHARYAALKTRGESCPLLFVCCMGISAESHCCV